MHMQEKTRQVSVTICKRMNDKIQEYVDRGLFSDRQEMIVTAIRNHAHTLLECAAESMAVNGHLRASADPSSERIMMAGRMSKFVTASFDGSGLLDVCRYHFPGEPLEERVNIRIPCNLLEVWSDFAPYSADWTKQSDYIRKCIVMEMLRIDEDEKILSAVRMYRDGGASPEEREGRDHDLWEIVKGRHGNLINYEPKGSGGRP